MPPLEIDSSTVTVPDQGTSLPSPPALPSQDALSCSSTAMGSPTIYEDMSLRAEKASSPQNLKVSPLRNLQKGHTIRLRAPAGGSPHLGHWQPIEPWTKRKDLTPFRTDNISLRQLWRKKWLGFSTQWVIKLHPPDFHLNWTLCNFLETAALWRQTGNWETILGTEKNWRCVRIGERSKDWMDQRKAITSSAKLKTLGLLHRAISRL